MTEGHRPRSSANTDYLMGQISVNDRSVATTYLFGALKTREWKTRELNM